MIIPHGYSDLSGKSKLRDRFIEWWNLGEERKERESEREREREKEREMQNVTKQSNPFLRKIASADRWRGKRSL